MNHNEPTEVQVVYAATIGAITRTRGALLALSMLVGIGGFHTYEWYLSWDRARVAAREGVVESIALQNSKGKYVGGSVVADSLLRRTLQEEARAITATRATARVKMPLLGLEVPVADVSTGILITAVGILMWLVFYQRRVETCIEQLQKASGWVVPIRVLETHFALMGKHATPAMRAAAKILLLAMPVLALVFLLSDSYDLYRIHADAVQRLAFDSRRYMILVYARLGVDLFLLVAVAGLSGVCFRDFQNMEARVFELVQAEKESG